MTGAAVHSGAGFYYQPTLLAGCKQSDEIVQREVFGPVVTVTRFDELSQAVDWANDSEYALASSVWTQNLDKAMQVASRLQYGCTWINSHFMLVSEMPHGGLKRSAIHCRTTAWCATSWRVTASICNTHAPNNKPPAACSTPFDCPDHN